MDINQTLQAMTALAVGIRQAVEYIKNAIHYDQFPATKNYQQYIDIGLVLLLGAAGCVFANINLVAALGFAAPAIAGQIATGLLITLPATLLNELVTFVENANAKS